MLGEEERMKKNMKDVRRCREGEGGTLRIELPAASFFMASSWKLSGAMPRSISVSIGSCTGKGTDTGRGRCV